MVEKKKVSAAKSKTPTVRKNASSKKSTPKSSKKRNVAKTASRAKRQTVSDAKKAITALPKAGDTTMPRAVRARGQPTTYTDEIAVKILVEVAMGKSMRSIAAMKTMPAMSTIFLWLRTHQDFSEQYARAKEEAADLLVEEILDIADDGSNDYMEKLNKDGEFIGYMINGEYVQRSRLRIETRKWLAVKLKPKRYGDKLQVEANSKIEGNVTHKLAEKSDEELRAIAAAYAMQEEKAPDAK